MIAKLIASLVFAAAGAVFSPAPAFAASVDADAAQALAKKVAA